MRNIALPTSLPTLILLFSLVSNWIWSFEQPRIVDVQVGGNSILALSSDGELWGWGDHRTRIYGWYQPETFGPTLYDSNSYQQISVSKMTSSNTYPSGSAIDSLGQLWIWGSFDLQTPTLQPGQTFLSLSSGNDYQLAIASDSTLWSWGNGSGYKLGTGNTSNITLPAQVNDTQKWLQVSAGTNYSLAIASDSTLWGWGVEGIGQFGNGSSTSSTLQNPTQVSTDKFIHVASGIYHSAAIKSDSTLWTWGSNTHGQLGLGDTTSRNTPQQVGTEKYISIALGKYFSIALRSDSTLWSWGNNQYMQLGSFRDNHLIPHQVSLIKFTQISADQENGAAIDVDSNVYTWGNNDRNGLGIYEPFEKNFPYLNEGYTCLQVDHQGYGSYLIDQDSLLYEFGYVSMWDVTPTPLLYSAPRLKSQDKFIDVNAGRYQTLALKADSTLWGWGKADQGQLLGLTPGDTMDPIQLSPEKFIKIQSNELNLVVLRADSLMFAWGRVHSFSFLDPNTHPSNYIDTMTQMSNEKFIDIRSNDHTIIGLRDDSTLWAYGLNNTALLGDSALPTTYDWVKISDEKFVQFDMTAGGAIALDTQGLPWFWGTDQRNSSFKKLPNITQRGTQKYIKVFADETAYFAVDSTQALWSWGYNMNGTLGTGARVIQTPIRVQDMYVNDFSGYESALACDTLGRFWSWGSNHFGIAGNGHYTRGLTQAIEFQAHDPAPSIEGATSVEVYIGDTLNLPIYLYDQATDVQNLDFEYFYEDSSLIKRVWETVPFYQGNLTILNEEIPGNTTIGVIIRDWNHQKDTLLIDITITDLTVPLRPQTLPDFEYQIQGTSLHVSQSNPGETIQVEVLDTSGRLVQQSTSQAAYFVTHLASLPTQIYWIKITSSQGSQTLIWKAP